MQRQNQYQEYVKKLKKAQVSNSADQHLKQLSDKTDYMLTFMKDHMPATNYTKLLWLFVIPFGIISLISWYVFGSIFRFVPFLCCLAFLAYCRHGSIQLSKSRSFETLKENESFDSLRYVKGKVDHVKKGIEIKRHRILEAKYLYTLFFPFLLFLAAELLLKRFPFNNVWIGIIAAFVIGSYWWKYVFAEDLDELNHYENSLNSDLVVLRQRV